MIDLLRQEDIPRDPVAWLFTTVRRRAMNLARGERRREEHQRQAGQERASWFLASSETEWDSEELAAMLEQLPSLEREIVVARIWGELSFDQIAELVAISSSAAHRRYHKALSLLGDMMNESLEKPGQNHEPRQQIAERSDL